MQAQERGTAVNIRPGVAVIGLFPHMNYKPWFALGELVNNALASFLRFRKELEAADPDYRCRIDIEVSGLDGGFIRVADNAAGIAADDYQRAFVTAEPPPDASGLSQFGVGMKSASCWFARRWEVRTTALGEAVERTIHFDVPHIVEEGIEQLEVTNCPADDRAHYTELRLWDLNKPPQGRTIGKMADHLASIYRIFLERGDVDIRFNDKPLAFSQPHVLVARPYNDDSAEPIEWRKQINFDLATGESVTGFAAIHETASVAKAGLSLFRKDRLIVGSDEDTYRPAEIFGAANRFRYQRVFGELHLDGFDISHTKDGFIWGDREQTFLDLLHAALDEDPLPLLRQAENYRSRAPTTGQRNAGIRALESTARAIEQSGEQLGALTASSPKEERLPTDQQPADDIEERALRVWVGGQAWDIAIELSGDPSLGDWVSIASAPTSNARARHLGIRIALAHPFMIRFGGTTEDEIDALMRVAAGLALAEITAREAGVKMAGIVRRNLNELLRGSLAEP